MSIRHFFAIAAGLVTLTAASAAKADCGPCESGERYCGTYDYANRTWISGAWQTCSIQPPPPVSQQCFWNAISTQWVQGSLHGTGCMASTVGSYCNEHQEVIEVDSCTGATQTVPTGVERTCLVNGQDWQC